MTGLTMPDKPKGYPILGCRSPPWDLPLLLGPLVAACQLT